MIYNINILLTVIFFININYAINIKNKSIRSASQCECPLEEVPSCTCKPSSKFIVPSTEMSCHCLTELLCNCMERIKKLEEQQQRPYFDPSLAKSTHSTTSSPFYLPSTTSSYDSCTVNCNKICLETCQTTPIHRQNACYNICKNTCEASCQQPETPIYSTTHTPIYTTTATPNYEMEYETIPYSNLYTTQPNYPIYPSSMTTTSSPSLFYDINNPPNECLLKCLERCGENSLECISECQNACDCEKACRSRCVQISIPIYSCMLPCHNTCSDRSNIVTNLRKHLNNRKVGMSKLATEVKKDSNKKPPSSFSCLKNCYQNCQVNNTLGVCSNYCPELCNCADSCTEYCGKENIPNSQCENSCIGTCKISNKYNKYIKESNSKKNDLQPCDEKCFNNCNLSLKCDGVADYNKKENCKYECKKRCKHECTNQEVVINCAKISNNDSNICVCPNGYRSCGNNNYCCLLR
uniref:Uncharacterized protein n=1 Tax=Strongyloides stercoralis TaxID=6248 RepID=A0AAF5DIN2_STRER